MGKRKCQKRDDYSCFTLPNDCDITFDKFKRECKILIAYTPDEIIISSGYLNRTMQEDNYYIASGITPHDPDTTNTTIDVILFGVRRPKVPLTRDNNKRQKDVKIDPSYYMPDGSLNRH